MILLGILCRLRLTQPCYLCSDAWAYADQARIEELFPILWRDCALVRYHVEDGLRPQYIHELGFQCQVLLTKTRPLCQTTTR